MKINSHQYEKNISGVLFTKPFFNIFTSGSVGLNIGLSTYERLNRFAGIGTVDLHNKSKYLDLVNIGFKAQV